MAFSAFLVNDWEKCKIKAKFSLRLINLTEIQLLLSQLQKEEILAEPTTFIPVLTNMLSY